MEKTKEKQEVLLDDATLEKSFDEAVADLQKSIGEEDDSEDKENLEKAKKPPMKDSDEEDEDEGEEEAEEEEEEEDEEETRKSIEDSVAEDAEAEAAMDVEPYLRKLVKSIDETLADMTKAIHKRFAAVEAMVKSQSKMLLAQAALEKANKEKIEKIGRQPVAQRGILRLQKSRFGNEGPEFSPTEVLMKSHDWLKNKKINVVEAGMIELRANKGLLGKIGDHLDHKVKALVAAKEASE